MYTGNCTKQLHTAAVKGGKEAGHVLSQLPGRPSHLRAGQGRPAASGGHGGHRAGGAVPLCALAGRVPGHQLQRAYEALEAEGYLSTQAGKGCFASPRSEVSQARRTKLLEQFDAAVGELLFLGMTTEELKLRVCGAKEEGEA